MTERMYRAQILLDPRQRRRLEEIARREGKSISAVTRQVIDAGLELIEDETELWKKRARLLAGLLKRFLHQDLVSIRKCS